VPVSEPELPDAELEVLACLWRQGGATVRRVREAMQEYRPMSHASAFTLLRRLEAKGLVRREKARAGKAFVFRPTTRPGRTYRRVVKSLLDRVFGGSAVALVSSLFETRPPTKQELDELQTLLDGLRHKGAKKGGGA
jgi:BlaI family penicillinase repressor